MDWWLVYNKLNFNPAHHSASSSLVIRASDLEHSNLISRILSEPSDVDFKIALLYST